MGASKRKKRRARGGSQSNPSSSSSRVRLSVAKEAAAEPCEKQRMDSTADGASSRTKLRSVPPEEAAAAPSPGVWGQGGDPAVKPRGAALWGLNLLIGGMLFLFTVDALPNSIPGLGRLNTAIDVVVDKLGLAQGEWKLFSPDPDHINAYIEAIITFSDGSTTRWTTTKWRNRSLIEKFFQGRHPKFSDAFRMDRNKFIWPYLTDYIVKQVTAPEGAHVTKVELIRHWWEVPLPKDMPAEMKKFKHMPPHRSEFPEQYSFFTKKY